MYCLRLIESALENIMDDGYGKNFKRFSNEEKQEVINAVIEAFNDDNLFILRDKYVITGKSGVLSAEDFKITKWQPIETAPKDGSRIVPKPVTWGKEVAPGRSGLVHVDT